MILRLPTALFVCAISAAFARADEIRRVDGLEIDRVEIRGSVSVEISQGDSVELRMRGDAEKLDRLPFTVRGSTLILGQGPGVRGASSGGVQYRLQVRELSELSLRGSAEVYVQPLQVGELRVLVDGSGDARLFALRSDLLDLELRGSGDLLVAELTTRELRAVLAGSGDVHVRELSARRVGIVVNGSGDLSVEQSTGPALDELKVNLVGSGDIDLRGLPARQAEVNVLGSGSARLGRVNFVEATIVGSGDVSYQGDAETDLTVLGSGSLERDD